MNDEIFYEIDYQILLQMSGAILRKAELEKNYKKVYTKIFEHLVKMEVLGFRDMVEIFGNLSG
ncbi:MAG: hypothetical protein QXR09_03565 [Candidatus Aenigmatarchaeota archaeon]